MSTELVKMGEQTGRKTPEVVVCVRDNGAELVKQTIALCAQVTTNKVDDKEAIEGIVGEVMEKLNVLLRCLERVGAQTRPEDELLFMVHGKRVIYEDVSA